MASIPASLQSTLVRLPVSGAAGNVVHPSLVRTANGEMVQMLQIGGDLFKISVVGQTGGDEAINMVNKSSIGDRNRTNIEKSASRHPGMAVKVEKDESDDDLDSSNSSARYDGLQDTDDGERLMSFANTAAGDGTTIVQGPDGQFFIPVSVNSSSNDYALIPGQSIQRVPEVIKKRELRMLKNREAAKECRRKKKDYVRCLENRVTLLENQNKTLIAELKSLKELYCQK